MDQTNEPDTDLVSDTNDSDSSVRAQINYLRVGKAQEELAESALKVQIAQERLLEASYNKLAAQLLTLPHRSLPLKIYNDGLSWIAIYECPEGEPLVGRGDSPQLALCDFDKHWLGMK